MFKLLRRNTSKWFLFLFLFSFALECIPEKAEAARRGRGLFGRISARLFGVPRRARVSRARRMQPQVQVKRRQVARNIRNVNNDIFGLDIEPTTDLSSFSNFGIDPRRQLQRLSQFSNIGVDRGGQLFELNNGSLIDPRQPLVQFNGQVVRGALGGMLPDTLNQVRELNENGNFRILK